MFDALLTLLAAPDELTVLVIEDAHWADEATLDLLRYLGSRIRGSRALILVTYRDEGLAAGDPLRIAVGEVSTQRSTRRIGLPRLSESAVADDGRRAARWTRSSCTGSPAETRSCQRGAADRQTRRSPRRFATLCLPDSAVSSPETRRVLETAALLGVRMEPAALQAVDPCTADSCR